MRKRRFNLKQTKTSVLKRLLPYSGKKAYMLHLAMIFSGLSGIAILMPMVFIHRIISGIILSGVVDTASVTMDAVYAAAFAFGGFLLYTCSLILSHIFAFEVEHNMIKSGMERLLYKPPGFFANRESGKLRKIIISGAGETHSFLAHQLPDFASTTVSPIVLLVFFFWFDWRLGLSSLVSVLIGMYFMATMMSKKSQEYRKEYFSAMADMASESVEYVRGIPVVKTFAQSVESFERFHRLIIRSFETVMNMTLGWKNKMSLFEAIAGSTAFFLVPIAILLISTGADIREVIGNSVIYLLIGPAFNIFIMRSAYITQYMYIAGQSLDKIDEVLAYEDLHYGDAVEADNTIEFSNVSFLYDEDKECREKKAERNESMHREKAETGNSHDGETSTSVTPPKNPGSDYSEHIADASRMVLHNISFKVEPGKTVAIVGASGSGKTTIARLAARFYDATEGMVRIGGVDIRSFEKTALMNKIAFVFQNTALFKMSLRENLLLANPNATEEEIEDALVKSGSKEIIDRLERGLDTVYGTKGIYFSGGEIQRLSIARAFLKNAGILILDEATAFADPENEHIIQASFRELAKNRTTLMIAHRLSTIIDADTILVIEGGNIVERGTHQELLQLGGVYKRLWDEYERAAKWRIGGAGAKERQEDKDKDKNKSENKGLEFKKSGGMND